jgi:hypothetical protein
MKPTEFAEPIQRAQELKENSWDGKVYKINDSEAATTVVIAAKQPLDWAGVIALLNMVAWNDIQCWANAAKNFTLADYESMGAARISYGGY